MKTVLLVVCEGKTEENLLRRLRGTWRISSAMVELVGQAGEPRAVVRRAERRREEITRALPRRERDAFKVWVVFDRDTHEHWQEAIRRAENSHLELGDSNPCIELWGLLLHREQMAEIDTPQAQRALRELHPDYDHRHHPYFELQTVIEHMDEAHSRAETLRVRTAEHGSAHGNPSTRFHLVLEAMKGLRSTPG